MSDTPETDAKEAWPASKLKLGNDGVVPAEFSRRLERERDEWHFRAHENFKSTLDARAERDEARDAAQKAKAYKRVLKETNAQLKRERDEARDALMRIEDLFIDGTDVCADREKMGSIARAALEETKPLGVFSIDHDGECHSLPNVKGEAPPKSFLRTLLDRSMQLDEAQAARDILRLDAQKEAEHHDRMIGELEKVYAERDEAREKVNHYRDKLDLNPIKWNIYI